MSYKDKKFRGSNAGGSQKKTSKKLCLRKICFVMFLSILWSINLIGGYYDDDPVRAQSRPKRGMFFAEQSDGTKVQIFTDTYQSGYINYAIPSGHNLVFDEKKRDWCYAIQGEDGWLESSGYSIHLHTGEELGIKPHIRPTKERLDELEQRSENSDNQTRRYDALYRKMKPTGNVETLVIYVLLSDHVLGPDTLFIDTNNYFNGLGSTQSAQRYYRNMSNNALNLSFHFEPYHDSLDI